MRLSACGREDAKCVFQPGELRVDADRAAAEGLGVAVTYHDDRPGMLQDFLVRERPAGSEPLRLWVDLELHGVAIEVATDDGEVTFVRVVSGGARVMLYGDLKVHDADGRLSEAEMVKEDEEQFGVAMDDDGATHPILVDPLSSSPDWTAESNQGGALFGYSVSSAGDVNGDGYNDVVVGAHGYDSGEDSEGRAYVYYGNDGDGLHVLPQQWRTDLVTSVVPALKTRSASAAGLGLRARTFFGRNDLKVHFEAKPLGTSFDGTGLVSTGWIDPNLTGTAVSEVIGGLSNDTMYKWRARVGYRLSDGAPQPYSHWIYQPYNGGLGEVDFQVSDDDLPPNVPELQIFRLSPSGCRLWWYTVPGATAYDLYRGTSAFFATGSPWQTVAAPDTSYDFGGGGNPATNFYFLCRAVGSWGESGDSNRVGEFDFDTAVLTAGKKETEREEEWKKETSQLFRTHEAQRGGCSGS